MKWLIPMFAALVFDAVVGVITHTSLSITSLSTLATNLLTLVVMGVFLVVETIGIVLISGRKHH